LAEVTEEELSDEDKAFDDLLQSVRDLGRHRRGNGLQAFA